MLLLVALMLIDHGVLAEAHWLSFDSVSIVFVTAIRCQGAFPNAPYTQERRVLITGGLVVS